MVLDQEGDHSSRGASVLSISAKIRAVDFGEDLLFGADPARVGQGGRGRHRQADEFAAPLLGRDPIVEAKARASGFAQTYTWLEGRDAMLQLDRKRPLVVLPLALALEVMRAAEGRGNQSAAARRSS